MLVVGSEVFLIYSWATGCCSAVSRWGPPWNDCTASGNDGKAITGDDAISSEMFFYFLSLYLRLLVFYNSCAML